jgi:hypothetical protein
VLEGRYTDAYLEQAGGDAPRFTDEDLRIIGSPMGFVGINVYLPKYYVLASDEAPGWRVVPLAKSHAKTAADATIGREAMYWDRKFVQSLWNANETFVTSKSRRQHECWKGPPKCLQPAVSDVWRGCYRRAFADTRTDMGRNPAAPATPCSAELSFCAKVPDIEMMVGVMRIRATWCAEERRSPTSPALPRARAHRSACSPPGATYRRTNRRTFTAPPRIVE